MYQSWYESHYHEMSGCGQWFRGNGFNILSAEKYATRAWRVLIVRMSTARDTSDSFTHQLLYQIAAQCDNVFVDCAWLPPPEDGVLFDRDGIPWLTGVVSKRPATDFDCIAFSHSVVQELVNLPVLLEKSRIPLTKSERNNSSPAMPLILLGGANAINCGILLSSDPIVDALFVGEDVRLIKEVFCHCRDARINGSSHADLLQKLLQVNGVVLPDSPIKTYKKPGPMSSEQLLYNAPLFGGGEGSTSGALQISEGCPGFCTFCAESWSRKPYRELSSEQCLDAALAMKVTMGLDTISLYSFNFNMHRSFKELLTGLHTLFGHVGMKSQRIDGIADDPDLMPLLHAAGKSSITVGVEGISSRLRSRLQKSISENQLTSGLKRILSTPLRELKLFFIATGWETPEDFIEFRSLLQFIAETMVAVKRQPRIIISITPLVRFPFTPLESDAAPLPAVVSGIIRQCERVTAACRFDFRSAASTNDYLFSQLMLRCNDTKIWDTLIESLHSTGFAYYKDISDQFITTFVAILAKKGFSIEQLLRPETFLKLPVTLAVDAAFIASTAEASMAQATVASCLGTVNHEGTCAGCGACTKEGTRLQMTGKRTRSVLKSEQLKKVIVSENRCFELSVLCTIPPHFRGSTRREIAAAMSSFLMRSNDVCARLYRGFGGSMLLRRFNTPWICGADSIILNFQENALESVTKMLEDESLVARLRVAVSDYCLIHSLHVNVVDTRPVMLTLTSPWDSTIDTYLKKVSLKYTLIREAPGGASYQLSKEATKKRIITSLRDFRHNDECCIEVVPGEKFNYDEFLCNAIAFPTEKHRFRVHTTASLRR